MYTIASSMGLLFMLQACSPSAEPAVACREGSPDSALQVYNALPQGLQRISADWVLEGLVASSDEGGNFYREVYLQGPPGSEQPTIVLHTDLIESHKSFPPGSRVRLSLLGTHARKEDGLLHIGYLEEFFGNPSLSPIPSPLLANHVRLECVESGNLPPLQTGIQGLDSLQPGTLVKLVDVQFAEGSVGNSYALPEEDRVHSLMDCKGNEVEFFASGYADFQEDRIPSGKGTVTGLFLKEGGDKRLVIRNLTDLDLSGERCQGPELNTVALDSLLITEVADPDNLSEARFLEIQNVAGKTVALDGWVVERYTNDSGVVSSSLSLDGISVTAGGFLLIARDTAAFRQAFGFPAHIQAGRNSVSDSNGDDNLVLRNPEGAIVDILGRIGEDGTGTDHEFEDGRALRRPEVLLPRAEFDPGQWQFWNDSGDGGTINLPQQAPEDFSPGSRNP